MPASKVAALNNSAVASLLSGKPEKALALSGPITTSAVTVYYFEVRRH
jgi:hypothetical protein